MSIIDKAYRKEELLDWELKSLTQKYSDFSFSKKSTWINLRFLLLISAIIALIVPFIPPRSIDANWAPPETIEAYLSELTLSLIIIPIMILVSFIFIMVRNRIDLQLKYKWKGNFKVINVFNPNFNLIDVFGPRSNKILILNSWCLFIISPNQPYYNSVKSGQIISIKRTITFRLIDYYIRDEEKFLEEYK
jgi:hypothetical protein